MIIAVVVRARAGTHGGLIPRTAGREVSGRVVHCIVRGDSFTELEPIVT